METTVFCCILEDAAPRERLNVLLFAFVFLLDYTLLGRPRFNRGCQHCPVRHALEP